MFRNYYKVLTIIFLFIFAAMMFEKDKIDPPKARAFSKTDTLFGDLRKDDYFWLSDKNNPEVLEYLLKENDYTSRMMKQTEKIQEKLFNELRNRIKEDDSTVPVKIDNYFYYYRTRKGEQYPLFCRKKGTETAPEEILVDQNRTADGYQFYHIEHIDVSPDHLLLAFSADTSGDESFTIYIKDISKNQIIDTIQNSSPSFEWVNNSKMLVYTVLDEIKRPYKLMLHKIGEKIKDDILLLKEDNNSYHLNLYKTKSKAYFLLYLENISSTEVKFLNADNPFEQIKTIANRENNIQYIVEHNSDKFFILTNENAQNFRLMETYIDSPSKNNWKEIIPAKADVYLENLDVFKNYLIIYERKNGLQQIRIWDISNNEIHYIDFDEPLYSIEIDNNPDFNSHVFRFTYSSLITPHTIIDYNMNDCSKTIRKVEEVGGNYNKDDYKIERTFAKSEDGKSIPISILYKNGIEKNGNNPLYMYGYGAYGINTNPAFSSKIFSLVNRGVIYAIAHIRGGSELGRQWYDEGKMLNKKNTFNDFISCAEFLINEKYTSSEKLVIMGGSAGGLLIGTVLNMRPDLFKAAIAHVPFVDVLNTMLDESLPLTIMEFDEWGNPVKKIFYDYIKSYSPYDNITEKDYPDLLITTGLNDSRVSYWEPAKWVAKLRSLKKNNNVLLLKVNMDTGHSGQSGRYDYLKDIAFEYAFIFDRLNIGF